jgi:hypothetical protein
MGNEVIFSVDEKEIDGGDAEQITAATKSAVPGWVIVLSSIFLVFISTLLAFLAVMAFSATHPIIRPYSPTPTMTPLSSTGDQLCARPALRQEW